jgi:hypothetical protein
MDSTPTRVVHLRKEPYDVYIGRAVGRARLKTSIWGNSFRIGRDGTREEVIAKYRDYILSRPDLMARLPELKGKTLGCWCKPLPCHGDVLAELAEMPTLEEMLDRLSHRPPAEIDEPIEDIIRAARGPI